MSTGSETLRGAPNRLLRAWLAIAAVMVTAVLALVLWASFGPSSTSEGTSGNGGAGKEVTITKMYPDGRFGGPIQVGDFVCQQCQ